MNYREAIWGVQEARAGYQRVLPCVDVLVTNRSVSEMLFDAVGDDEDLLWRYRREFGCATVCLTGRCLSGEKGSWVSMALHEDRIYYSEEVEFNVIDVFGTGDAFFAGFLHGYLESNIAFALNFGNAFCALAHTIEGDVADVSSEEVMGLLEQGRERRVWYVKR
jgi:2-dehydro-3-deoxygluconokinase